MFSFKGFFTKEKNTHLEHLEDDIINRGSQGGVNAVNFLNAVRNMLAGNIGGKLNMSVKWDGAPLYFVASIQKTANSLSVQNQYSIKLLK